LKKLSPSQREAILSVVVTPTKKNRFSSFFGAKKKNVPSTSENTPPPGPPPEEEWKEATTSDGKKYYYNVVNGQSRWDRPRSSFSAPSSGSKSIDTRKYSQSQDKDIFEFLTPEEKAKLESNFNKPKALGYDPNLYEAMKREEEKEKKIIT